MALYGIYGRHEIETCPINNLENAKGIKVLSMYHSGLEHTFEWTVEAPGAHVIQDLMVETKVAKFNAIKNCSIMDNCKSSEVPQKY